MSPVIPEWELLQTRQYFSILKKTFLTPTHPSLNRFSERKPAIKVLRVDRLNIFRGGHQVELYVQNDKVRFTKESKV